MTPIYFLSKQLKQISQNRGEHWLISSFSWRSFVYKMEKSIFDTEVTLFLLFNLLIAFCIDFFSFWIAQNILILLKLLSFDYSLNLFKEYLESRCENLCQRFHRILRSCHHEPSLGFFCNLSNQTFSKRLKISVASFLKAQFVEKSDMIFLMIWFSFYLEK